MEEFSENPPEIRNLDELSFVSAFLVGSISTMTMGLIPILNTLCCLHYCIGAFLTIAIYTSSNKVTIPVGHAIWKSFQAVFAGAIAATVISGVMFLSTHGTDLTGFKEQIVEEIAEQGQGAEEAIEFIENVIPDELDTGAIIVLAIFSIFTAGLASLFGAAIGGSLGSAVIKRGPLAQ
ncbi:MAG: hypothetical protein AAGB46_13150 [Verrucomicrobiota bacterium]